MQDKQWLINVLKRPDELEASDESRLREMIAAYPFFQQPRLLLTRCLKMKNHPDFQEQLGIASLYAMDRSRLYELVNKSEAPEEDRNVSALLSEKPYQTHQIPVAGEINLSEVMQEAVDESYREPEAIIDEEKTPQVFEEPIIEEAPEILIPEEDLSESVDEPVPEEPSEPGEEETPEEEEEEPEEMPSPEEEELSEELIYTEEIPIPVGEQKEEVLSEEEVYTNAEAPLQEEPAETSPQAENFIEVSSFAVDFNHVEKESETVSDEKELTQEIPFLRKETSAEAGKTDFFHWLEKIHGPFSTTVTETKPEELKPDIEEKVVKEKTLIEEFIAKQPSITRTKVGFYDPVNMAKESEKVDEELVTETLARIYQKQELYGKAIRIYEKLMLKYPLKKAYFAALIEEIKQEKHLE